MKWQRHLVCLFILFLGVSGLGNPYAILSVDRRASLQEIRKAYKQLAIEWHPDKNKDPAAETRFVEIKQAYELLSDPERRKHFDNTGLTGDGPQFHNRPDYSQYRRSEPLDDLFGFQANGFKFQFKDRDTSLFHRLSITTRAYEGKLVPKSARMPQLILFYSDWCFSCLQVEPVWRRIIDDLEPIGFGIATVHAENERLLTRKVGVHSLPCLIMLMDGKPSIYRESLFSVQKVVEFARGKFPYKLVGSVSESSVDAFLAGWSDNRVRALIFERQENVRLRYLLMAFYYRDRVAFGFVQLNAPDVEHILLRYKVPRDMDSLLLFNENVVRPVASLSMTDIPIKTMHDVIDSNKYLALPRLSSQDVFDALCPPAPRKRLCVVLVSEDAAEHEGPRKALRQYAQDAAYTPDRVRFSYILQERQSEFVSALSAGEPRTLHVVILWRRDTRRLQYEWLPGPADAHRWNETRDRLELTIARLLRSAEALSYEAVVTELIDEHAQGIVSRVLSRLLSAVDLLRDSISKDELLSVLSVLATLVVIGIAGYIMSYLIRLEEKVIKGQDSPAPAAPDANGNVKAPAAAPELRLHELRGETFNGMVRLLKPGCRTLVLLVDSRSRTKLIPDFHRMVWPYRKNKTLMFGHLNLDRGLEWYKTLLTMSLPEERELNINPKNCIGTVLSLTGHRKYFCMYHAKHPEWAPGAQRPGGAAASGAFLGLDGTDSEPDDVDVELGAARKAEDDKYSNLMFQGNLLDGFPNWLDRLFEGTTQRYYINYWPDFTSK